MDDNKIAEETAKLLREDFNTAYPATWMKKAFFERCLTNAFYKFLEDNKQVIITTLRETKKTQD